MTGFEIFVAFMIAMLVVSVVMMSKQQKQPGTDPSLDVDAPVAQEGKHITVLFGTRDITGPNVVWFGDLKSVAIRKKTGGK